MVGLVAITPAAGFISPLSAIVLSCIEIERIETYRGTTLKLGMSEKIRLEIGVSDSFVERTVRAILGAASTGEVGDGKIFVLPVEKVYRIRTAEEDEAAVTPVAMKQAPAK